LHQSHNYKYIRSKFVLEVHTMVDDRPENSDEGRRTLTSGDIVATQVQRTDDGSLAADATDWNQITHFNFREEVPHLSEGEQILIRILSAGKYLAYAEPVDISGYMMRVTLEPGSRFATPVDTDYRVLVRLDDPPVVGGFANIKVTGVSDVINGRIHSYDNDPPEVGDRFRTHLDHGSGPHRVQLSDQNCDLLLSEDVLVTGDVELEITEVDCPMQGIISSYCGNLPEIGYTFRAQAERSPGPHQAAPPNERYPVVVNEDILVSGKVEIEIVEHGLPMQGKISSYCGNLPEIGHTFHTPVEYGSGPHRVLNPEEQYAVVLGEDILISGKVEVEVVEHDLPMVGEVGSYCGGLPEVGHTFCTEIRDGSGPRQIPSPDGRYEVHITEDVLISDKIEIEILEHGLPMSGRVSSYRGNLPAVGQSFDVSLSYGSDTQRVRTPDGRYGLSIDECILISGEAKVELTERGFPMKAKVLTYHRELPAVGDTITTRVRAGQRTVESPSETFQIELTERAPGPGKVRVRIADVSDAIYGKICEYESKDQDLSSYRSPRKASMVDNSYITGRKL
jgi:hypothetical protein